jgi:PhnB protein
MARVSTWYHMGGTCEEAFLFYQSIFKTEFIGPITRFRDIPAQPGTPSFAPAEANKIMHIALPILGGHVIRGNDVPEFMGQLTLGNNVTMNLEPDTRAEVDHLFAALKVGGKVECEPTVMFWGGYYASLIDRYGNEWMMNCMAE